MRRFSVLAVFITLALIPVQFVLPGIGQVIAVRCGRKHRAGYQAE